jgi:large subunit ribosomal protein L3
MPKRHKPRKGSLQFWPRSRAKEILPSVNWIFLYGKATHEHKVLGFFGYKVGMLRLLARDLTPHSLTKNKEIIIPATVLECPPLKLFSIRFYKQGKVAKEVVVSNEKELKKILKVPKQVDIKKLDDIGKNLDNYDDLMLVLYSNIRKTSIKKTPDLAEIALAGTIKEKIDFAKNMIGKELNVQDIFKPGQLVDLHAVTKGKGFQGPLKRFGIGKRQHKSEKGLRRPGTLGPWTPSRVRFYAPQAGQLGFFTRIIYNTKILNIATEKINPKEGFHNYGLVRNPYLIVKGSVQGPAKRPVLFTIPARPSKKILKENFEIIKILR